MSLFLEKEGKGRAAGMRRWCHIITISPLPPPFDPDILKAGAYLTRLPLRQGQKLLPLILARSWCEFSNKTKLSQKVQENCLHLAHKAYFHSTFSVERFSQWFLYTHNHIEELTLVAGVEWGFTESSGHYYISGVQPWPRVILRNNSCSKGLSLAELHATCWASWSLS